MIDEHKPPSLGKRTRAIITHILLKQQLIEETDQGGIEISYKDDDIKIRLAPVYHLTAE